MYSTERRTRVSKNGGKLKKILLATLIGCFFVQFCEASNGLDGLRKELEANSKKFRGKIGVSLYHLRKNERLELLGDEKFPTGSTIKVAMLAAAMEKVDKRELDYYQRFTLTEDDVGGGTGFLKNYQLGKQITLKELLHQMITASDNTATRMVLKAIGSDRAINDWLSKNNLKNTRINVPYPIDESVLKDAAAKQKLLEQYNRWGMGVSTPNEMALLMEMIATARAGSAAACDEMHRILNHQYFDDGIAGQIPPSVVVASKSGIEKHSRSDIAIVHAPSGTYILAIYTKDAADTRVVRENEQDAMIREISRKVWRFFEPGSKYLPPPGTEKFSTGPDW